MNAQDTWLADADDLAAAGALGVPPPRIRAGLGRGEMVEIGFLAPSLDGMGADVDRAPVLIVASHRGRYEGVLPDGQPIGFHASNVLGVLGPEMSGIFDWIKKMRPPLPSAPPPPAEPGLPALPAPRPAPGLPVPFTPPEPPRRTFMQAFREVFGLKPPAIPTGRPAAAETRGLTIFEAFRPREEVRRGGLPTLAPQAGPPAPFVAPPSGFAKFAPEAPGVLERLRPTGFEVMEPERPGPIILAPPKQFEIFKPEPVTAEMIEAQKEQEMQLRKTLFEPEPEVAPTVQQMFRAFTPEEIAPPEAAAEAARREMPPGLPRKLKVLPLPPRTTFLPSLEDVTRGFYTYLQPMEEFWEYIRETRKDPGFQRDVAQSLHAGSESAAVQFETLGVCGGRPDIWEEVSSYFHIPWNEMRGRMNVETFLHQGEEMERWSPTERSMEEVLWPLKRLVDEAFKALQQYFAPDLPGAVEMDFGKHFAKHLCQMVLAYREGAGVGGEAVPPPRTPPPPPRPEVPSGKRLPTVPLGEILPPEAQKPVADLLNAVLAGRIHQVDALAEMVEILKRHEDVIKAKGFDIHYLAAVILYNPNLPRPGGRARSVPFAEVVPAGSIEAVYGLIEEALAGRIPSPEAMIESLKTVFEPYRAELEEKKIDAQILAEWIAREVVPNIAEQQAPGPAPRQINLFELLPKEVADQLLALVEEAKAGRVPNLHRRIMQMLVPYTQRLEAQEVDPTYLAYAIEGTVQPPEQQEPEEEPERTKPRKKRRR
jgi:hypothetical protein